MLRHDQPGLRFAEFSPDGSKVVAATSLNELSVHIRDVHFLALPPRDLIVATCTRRLRGISTVAREEMRLAGYPDDMPEIDVCAGVE